MIDNTRLNTMNCLVEGVIDRPIPNSTCPDNFQGKDVCDFEWNKEFLMDGLEKGGLSAAMYYGCWDIWKTDNGFSGELLQYRKITDSFLGRDIEYALEKAHEWANNCQG